MDGPRYTASRLPDEKAGGFQDTCSRCGQAVPITSSNQAEKLKAEKQAAFDKLKNEPKSS